MTSSGSTPGTSQSRIDPDFLGGRWTASFVSCNVLVMRRQFLAAALCGVVAVSACSGSHDAAPAGWQQSSTPHCTGFCAEFDRADTAASITILSEHGAPPSGDGFVGCGTLRGGAAVCRRLADTEQVFWQGAGNLLYEAQAKWTNRAELFRFLTDLDLKSAGLLR